jgi:autonomous glycyl radical cofactor GrcA
MGVNEKPLHHRVLHRTTKDSAFGNAKKKPQALLRLSGHRVGAVRS